MSTRPTNRAAWLRQKGGPFLVDDAPFPSPLPNEIIIRAHAVAINPVEGVMFAAGALIQAYPTVIGCDVAGVVHSIGSAVTRFKPGDRVIGMLDYEAERVNKGCFQLYCAGLEALSAKLPEKVEWKDGVVLSLALNTAAASLFQKANLRLPFPKLKPESQGKVLVVWGGSSAVGSCAIQMAKAAGFEVATTCSEHNFEYCKGLGADNVFDHRQEDVVDQMVKALEGKESAGVFDAVMPDDSIVKSAEIAHRLAGKKHVATVMVGPPTPQHVPEGLPEDVTTSYCTSAILSLRGCRH